MSAFESRDLNRVDWPMFQNGWITMYWKPEILEADVAWLADHDYQVHRLSCERWTSAKQALEDLGVTLGFPDYHGRSLDAFNDCLGDLDVPLDGGSVIILLGYDHFATVDRVTAYEILDILASGARHHMLFGRRLATLLQSEDPRLSFEPVGSTVVGWNRHEWLNGHGGV